MSRIDGLRAQPLFRHLTGTTGEGFLTVVTSLTLATLVFHGFHHAYFVIPFQLLAVAFLVVPSLQRNGTFWFLVACFSGAAVWLNWAYADNHKYLLFFWTVVLFLAFEQPEDQRPGLVRQGAHYLLFFTMAMAVVQKTLAPDYLSGEFFTFALMTDGRFTAFTSLVTGATPDMLAENQALYRQALDPVNAGAALPALSAGEGMRRLASVITWVNYLDQLAIAVLLLLPLTAGWQVVKHLLLMAFIVPVYLIAPVIGFGWLIIIWGYCLVPERIAYMRAGYVGLFLLLCLYEFPWLDLLV